MNVAGTHEGDDGPMPGTADLSAILEPRTVVHIGASRNSQVTRRLLMSSAEVFLVNPGTATMFGRSALSALKEVPCHADLAIVNRPAASVASVLRELAETPVRACLFHAAHVTAEDKRLMAEVAERSGIRIMGPNSAGLVTAAMRIDATSGGQPALFDRQGVSLISQSGGACTEAILRLADLGIGVRDVMSTGDEVDVTLEELLVAIVGGLPRPRIVLLFAEQFRRPRMLAPALDECARLGIPVGIVKIGKTAAAATAAMTHTGAVAGDWPGFAALARGHGATVCDTVEDLLDLAAVAMSTPDLARIGRGVGIITNSGGAGGLSPDLMESEGLVLADIGPATRKATAGALLDSLGHVTWNPLDSSTSKDGGMASVLHDYLPAADRDEGIDEVVLEVQGGIPYMPDAETVRLIAAAMTTPVVMCWPGLRPEPMRALIGAGVPVFEEPLKMWRALGSLARWNDWRRHGLADRRRPIASTQDPGLRARISEAPVAGAALLTYAEARELLGRAGLPQPGFVAEPSQERAVKLASDLLTPPFVAKLSSSAITHKSDAGGVVTGIMTVEELREACQTLRAKAGPDGQVVIEEQVGQGIELLASARRTVYGKALSAGWGGIYAEALHDVVMVIEPASDRDLVAALERTRVWDAYRHPRPPRMLAPVPALCAFLFQVLRILEDHHEVHEVEINPAIVNGTGVFAADVRIVVTSPNDGGGSRQ
jgi:acyl-CoA synthetase (NDP forming)